MALYPVLLAIDLPNDLKEKISLLQQNLDKLNLPIGWIDTYNAHLTLIYFGRIDREKLLNGARILDSTIKQFATFELGVGNIGFFGDESEMGNSVIYLDIIDREKKLNELYKKIVKDLSANNFYPPHRLHPHITLGRIKKQKDKFRLRNIVSEILDQDSDIKTSFIVDKVNLSESLTRSNDNVIIGEYQKAKYHKLRIYNLENQ